MKITKSQLKQIIKEELNEITAAQVDSPPSPSGTENKAQMHALGGSDNPYEKYSLPTGDTPYDIARNLLASGEEITEESVERAVLEAGVLDDDIPDFVDEVWVRIEELQSPPDTSGQSTSWLDAPPTMLPAQKPFSVLEPGVPRTMQEMVKQELQKLLNEGGAIGHYTGPEKEMYDVLKGERPPPQARDVASLMPIDNTEASMTPNYEREVEQLVYDMSSSGMSKEQIMTMVEQSLDFLMK